MNTGKILLKIVYYAIPVDRIERIRIRLRAAAKIVSYLSFWKIKDLIPDLRYLKTQIHIF